ncbi:MAG: hypothetical protein CBD74_02135 [Saprospirales bacterium TMED214]|nr:MAG: hypothetical protein CBD74_02135 [Saprospirales bacterium TMED214]
MEESLKIFVVEDSIEAVESLEILSKVIEENIQFVYHAMSIREALQEIPKHSFNVLVLDVTLPDGSGFDLLKQLGLVSYPVIIMTGDDTSAITAIRHRAFDYWVKPVKVDDLKQTYQKLNDYLFLNPMKGKLLVKHKGISEIILFQDILYVKAESNYARIVLNSGKEILVTRTLKSIESSLPSHAFFRTHNSYIIPTASIKKFHSAESEVELTKQVKIPVSRSRKKALQEVLRRLKG